MTAFAQVSGLWKRYAAVFRGGRGQGELFTERDWRVTLTDDRLIVDHPETDRAWIGGELERLVAAMGGTPL